MTEATKDNKGYFDFTTTKPVVGVFLNIDEKRQKKIKGKLTGDPKYFGTFLFDKGSDDLERAKAAAKEALKAAFPGKPIEEMKAMLADRFQDGDAFAAKAATEGKSGEFYKGKVVVSAATTIDLRRGYFENGKIVDLPSDQAAKLVNGQCFYSGVGVLVHLSFKGYQTGNNPPGVTAYLQRIVSTRAGEKVIGAGATNEEVFKDYIGLDKTDDPTAGTDEVW